MIVRLGETTVNVTEFNRWLPLATTLENPALETFMVGNYQAIGEFWPARFAVDVVTITTIPEPSAAALLTGGLVLLAARSRTRATVRG